MLINLCFSLVNLLLQGLSQELRRVEGNLFFLCYKTNSARSQERRRRGKRDARLEDSTCRQRGELVCFPCGDLGVLPG